MLMDISPIFKRYSSNHPGTIAHDMDAKKPAPRYSCKPGPIRPYKTMRNRYNCELDSLLNKTSVEASKKTFNNGTLIRDIALVLGDLELSRDETRPIRLSSGESQSDAARQAPCKTRCAHQNHNV
jgi:hypothetical protein